MKFVAFECPNCDAPYMVEYDENHKYTEKEPEYCPFCGELLDDDFYDSEHEDEYDSDE